jgi:hypothetical protein
MLLYLVDILLAWRPILYPNSAYGSGLHLHCRGKT